MTPIGFYMALAFAVLAFVFVPARVQAAFLRTGVPVLFGTIGLALFLGGHVPAGLLLMLAAAIVWFGLRRRGGGGGWGRGPRPRPRRPDGGGERRIHRTAALEAELKGGVPVDGVVLAGASEGAVLEEMNRQELLALRGEIAVDEQSRDLLDAYLDGRFADWREDAEPDADARDVVSPGAGAMGEQEAYEVLGLQPGASEASILAAHGRLLERAAADAGDSAAVDDALLARIDEAKSVLLDDHG